MADKKETEKEELPKLPHGFIYMMANREFTLRSTAEGRTLIFTPDTPIPVPRGMQADALAYGAFPMNDAQAELAREPVANPQKDPSSPDYRAAVRVAAEALLALNSPDDFGANGKPYATAWEREVGFRPIASIRDEVWDEVKKENWGK